MTNAAWTRVDDADVSQYDDRRSADLVGTAAIPTTSGFNVGVAWYTAEEFGTPQVHEDQEAVFVISGVGELRVGDDVVPLRPGTAVYVPPGTAHGGRRTSDEPVMVVYSHGAV
jgi:mannose-6-phosphate isomerase-like protein (cupin superfamily)